MIGIGDGGVVRGPRCGAAYNSFVELGARAMEGERVSSVTRLATWEFHSRATGLVVPSRALVTNRVRRVVINTVKDRGKVSLLEAAR